MGRKEWIKYVASNLLFFIALVPTIILIAGLDDLLHHKKHRDEEI